MTELFIKKYSYLSPGYVYPLPAQAGDLPGGGNFLTALYRSLSIDYPKFFKMDNLSKLGFLASELLWAGEAGRFTPREDLAVVCFNRSSSLDTDRAYQQTIGAGNFFPSPCLFVYTLPNIVTAEIAIRNKLFGETSFYICKEWNAEQTARTVAQTIGANPAQEALVAWLEYGEGTYEAFMMWIGSGPESGIPFSATQADNILRQMRTGRDSVLKNQCSVLENESSVLENQRSVLKNQRSVLKNQRSVLENERSFLKNQRSVLENQRSVLENQRSVLKNQRSVL